MKTYKALTIGGTIIRILIGLVFILSALFKYISIDSVDLFIFEHKLFSWVFTTIATRCLIAFEAIVGLMLIIGIYPRLTRFLTIISLILFSVYILVKPLLFDLSSENCHCFGTIIAFSDTQTLIKNIILLILSFGLKWAKWIRSRFSIYILISSIILCLSLSFIINPPEFIQTKLYYKEVKLRPEVFQKVKELDNVKALEIDKGRKVLCWFSTGCKYCKATATKLEIIMQRHNLDRNSFVQIFGGKQKDLDEFYKETNTKPINHTFINVISFLNTTYGKMPVIFLLDNGEIVKLYRSSTIDESYIVSFLKGEKIK
ncbi:MAG: DoxX family protein [Bacteroidales bacterium]|jgi:thiol-disulfide isomerase/thioredoxin/uncharacterized membrane protein YphA (DoxX/SURF4 family)|nr:DoxX family protein [Bacteroidales bacterium]